MEDERKDTEPEEHENTEPKGLVECVNKLYEQMPAFETSTSGTRRTLLTSAGDSTRR